MLLFHCYFYSLVGVFTVSDALLEKAVETEFTVMNDEHRRLSTEPNPLVSKIENAVMSAPADAVQTEDKTSSDIPSTAEKPR